MNPNRFVIGERVNFKNHVTGEEMGMMEVTRIANDFVYAAKFFDLSKEFKFTHTGDATWSCNLRISHQ